jgi:hypothetical protein
LWTLPVIGIVLWVGYEPKAEQVQWWGCHLSASGPADCGGISSTTDVMVIPPCLGHQSLVSIIQGVPREGIGETIRDTSYTLHPSRYINNVLYWNDVMNSMVLIQDSYLKNIIAEKAFH